jgi:arginyl-tRNA--protein-N-Asp/Glu arginylyltransferase
MKLVFSEAVADHTKYVYPYVVWAFPEKNESPADLFAAGFLPSSLDLSRFYLARQLRVPLQEWQSSSENRRVMRKAGDLHFELVPRDRFEVTPERRATWLDFAEARFGSGVMPPARLDRILASQVISHFLVFREGSGSGPERGVALLYLEPSRMAYYYYAFYDLAEVGRNLGMAMMTRAVVWAKDIGLSHLHLGTCYTEKALYKTQFKPIEFFNGHRWSRSRDELRHLLRTQPETHRLESPEYQKFLDGGLPAVPEETPFQVRLSSVELTWKRSDSPETEA